MESLGYFGARVDFSHDDVECASLLILALCPDFCDFGWKTTPKKNSFATSLNAKLRPYRRESPEILWNE